MEQVRNFARHAGRVGWFSAVVEFVFDWLTLARIHYDENGCMHSESTIRL